MSELKHWQGRNRDKDRVRHIIWQRLIEARAVTQDPTGKIPPFRQASGACDTLISLEIWTHARSVKCNPDTPQHPVRIAALHAGKTLLMSVPQLKQSKCFVQLTAQSVLESGFSIEEAAIAKHALKIGKLVSFEEMLPIDLVVVGCVAVDQTGGRTGKGAGFADLELGMLKHFGLINDQTPIVTTVDTLQIVGQPLPMEAHDWALDWVITPQDAIATHTQLPKPTGLNWSGIQADQWQNIPILQQLYKDQLQRELVIRPVRIEDAPDLLIGVNQVISEQKYLASAVPFSEADQRPYIENIIQQQYPMLVAECQGKIVGNCDIVPYPELGFQHVGRLGMWILPKYRGLGIGRSLLKQSLKWAKRYKLEKVELQVYADNKRAFKLYQSEGFRVDGTRLKVRKIKNQYQDLILMSLFLTN